MKKSVLLIIILAFLNACAEYTAVIGPSVTLAKSGNVIYSGGSAAAGYLIKKTTTKTITTHKNHYNLTHTKYSYKNIYPTNAYPILN